MESTTAGPVGSAADLSAMTVRVEHLFRAAPAAVWDLLVDLPRMATFSLEVVELSWTGPPAEVGSGFRARNRRGTVEWTVPGTVLVADRPHAFRWCVGDSGCPSSIWTYALQADDGGTRVVQHFQHGPGVSLVRRSVEADPSSAAEVVAGRSRMLAEGMTASLAAAERSLLA